MKVNRENIHNWRPRTLLNTRSRNCCVFEKFRISPLKKEIRESRTGKGTIQGKLINIMGKKSNTM